MTIKNNEIKKNKKSDDWHPSDDITQRKIMMKRMRLKAKSKMEMVIKTKVKMKMKMKKRSVTIRAPAEKIDSLSSFMASLLLYRGGKMGSG